MSTATLTPGAVKVALAALDTGGGVVSLANPEGADLIITRFLINVITVATAACTLDAGVAAAATTVSDSLIDGQDVNGATGVFDNFDDQGTNGQSCVLWPSAQYLTVSKKTGAAAGLAGFAYIEYVHV
jgi:hypothetical protein